MATKLATEDPNTLWIRYTQHSDHQARQRLILHYTPLVNSIVNSLSLPLPRSFEQDDLVSYGLVGLIDAVDRFDLSHQVKFETYASQRIRGQIIDTLRSLDLLPRSAYRRSREIQAAVAHLSQTLGQSPADSDIAEALDISLSEYRRWRIDTDCTIISLDQPMKMQDGEDLSLYDAIVDENMASPSDEVDKHEMKAQLIAALQTLPERDQLIISLYYNDGLTMKEIGQLLDVSESRVSQMHSKIILTLHAFFRQYNTPLALSN
jgi:RNA polymerase sigma factor for flagellar operon FliA